MYEYRAKVTRCVDGDTVDVNIDVGFDILYSSRVRLFGIDTPESRTRDKVEKKFGLLAKEYLKAFIKETGKDLIIKTRKDGKGKYGRILGELFKQGEDKSINTIMVEEGYAAKYTGQSKKDIEEEQLQNRQRLINEGLIEL